MKVNESTNAANLLMVGMQAKNSVSEDTMDFASVLSNTADAKTSSVAERNNQQLSETVEVGNDKKQTVSNCSSESVKNRSSDKTVQSADRQKVEQDKAEPSDEKVEGLDQNMTVEDGDETADLNAVVELLSSLLNEVSQILNVSPEDLSKTMDEMNLSALDLLDADNMKQLLLNVNQAEPSDLLMNEDLNNQLQSIMTKIEQTMDALENLQADVDNLEDVIPVEALMNSVSEESDVAFSDMNPQKDNGNTNDFAVTEGMDEPAVIVEDNRTDSPNQNQKGNQQSDTEPFETQRDDGKFLHGRQTQGKGAGFENQILQNIQDSLNQVNETTGVSDYSMVSPSQVIDQIVEQVKVQMNQDNTTLQMQLYPEHLGKIQINVVSKDGIMTAQIVAENDAAKQAIEGGLASLKESLENQNIKVDAIEVMVSTTGFQQNDEKNGFSENKSNTKHGRKIDLSELDEEDLAPEDIGEVEKMKATGSSVSYSV